MKLFPQMYTAATVADLRLVKPENARRAYVHSSQFQLAYCVANGQTYRYNSGSTDADDGIAVLACDDGGTWERVDLSGLSWNRVWVDAVRGNDDTGQLGGLPFASIGAALAAIGALATVDQTNWFINIAAGTYSETIALGATTDTRIENLVFQGDGAGRTVIQNVGNTDTITISACATLESINNMTFRDLTILNTSATAGTYAVEVVGGAAPLNDLFDGGMLLFDNCNIQSTNNRGFRATCMNTLVMRSCLLGITGTPADMVLQEVSQANLHDVIGATMTIRYDSTAALPANGRNIIYSDLVMLTGQLTLTNQPQVVFNDNCVAGDIVGTLATAAGPVHPDVAFHGHVLDDAVITYTQTLADHQIANFDHAWIEDALTFTNNASTNRISVLARWARVGGLITLGLYCDADIRHSVYTRANLRCGQADPGGATRPSCNRSMELYANVVGDDPTITFVDGAGVALYYPDANLGVVATARLIADAPIAAAAPTTASVVLNKTANTGNIDVTILHA